jgi:hypothetical protein
LAFRVGSSESHSGSGIQFNVYFLVPSVFARDQYKALFAFLFQLLAIIDNKAAAELHLKK